MARDIPGPRTQALRSHLARYESRNVTYLSDEFPVFWESAIGASVTDVDGNHYIDLESAFGVANVGHANPAVVNAIAHQAGRLAHGMGDVHPTEVRARLLQRLTSIVPPGLTKAFLASTGSEAVEAALKTAVLATGKSRFVAFDGAYHGLSLGALAVSGIQKFVEPFRSLVPQVTTRLPYPDAQRTTLDAAVAALESVLGSRDDIAAVVLEPIQGRGGCIVPPPGYLAAVRDACDRRGVLMIADEIYTGFGRTGTWFACEAESVTPDILCIGKAMGGGFPISAIVGREAIMDAWPLSAGEALHTSTYLGNPMGCAAALAVIEEIERLDLIERSATMGAALGQRLAKLTMHPAVRAVRGRGMMWGVELEDAASAERVVKGALARNVILLQSGPAGNVLSITPPLIISETALFHAIHIIEEGL